jgi:proline racemase
MFDKRVHLETQMDHIRKMVLFEPRGAVRHNANIVLPSNHPEAGMGNVILETTEYPAMSGSNTMCVATVLLETGILPMHEHQPDTRSACWSDSGTLRMLKR